ncbi:MAG: DUF4860 domain-containing protein [Lachnospiraceae bacterium]|nr:DUF4860 domain-containing protein [Lachnospiraceae bacterium]MBQ9607783.1 DUF4860 domain-containing protein [Lachnospiraceae bacterium]
MRKKNRIVEVFPILLFLIFTLSALGIVTFSVQIYRNIVERAEGRFDTETAAAYLSEKFRNHDDRGSIQMSDFMGNDAIAIEENIKEVPYITYIYVYDGYLRELFVEVSEIGNCTAADGNEILPMKSLDVEKISDSLLKVKLKDVNDKEEETYLSVKSRDFAGGDTL